MMRITRIGRAAARGLMGRLMVGVWSAVAMVGPPGQRKKQRSLTYSDCRAHRYRGRIDHLPVPQLQHQQAPELERTVGLVVQVVRDQALHLARLEVAAGQAPIR